MKRFAIVLLYSLLASMVFAQPFTFTISCNDSILYNGTKVPVGNMIQVIKPGSNGEIDAPNGRTNLGGVGSDDILVSVTSIGDGTDQAGTFSFSESAYPDSTAPSHSFLSAGETFFLRVWVGPTIATVVSSTPVPIGSHYVDSVPLTVPLSSSTNVDSVRFNGGSANPNWNVCGTALLSVTIGGSPAPGTYDFGSTTIGTTRSISVVITNEGAVDLHITSFETASEFPNNGVPTTLTPGNQTVVTISFSPTTIGNYYGTFVFIHDAPGNFYKMYLRGTGVARLPVELTSFTATSGLNSVTLNWRTETEQNNHLFKLERRYTTQTDWMTIVQISSQAQSGNSSTPLIYRYLDHNVVSDSTYQYRLSAVSLDGVVSVLGSIVSATPHSTTTVYPGDANNDGIVNIFDFLPICWYKGLTGNARNSATTNWIAQNCFVTNWTPVQAVYADCDGDGVVTNNEFQVVIQNWGRSSRTSKTQPVTREELLKESEAISDPAFRSEIKKAIQQHYGK